MDRRPTLNQVPNGKKGHKHLGFNQLKRSKEGRDLMFDAAQTGPHVGVGVLPSGSLPSVWCPLLWAGSRNVMII
jgi:hypothetical protein